jgi:serum/glucocorticoid-regulated kinase 2
LTYELLYGQTPFEAENLIEEQENIKFEPVKFPTDPPVSDEAKSFIMSLLEKDPQN